MRTLLKVAVCAALLTAASTSASPQGIFGGIAKKVSDAASQKAQDKVNSKIDEMSQKMVDNSFDAMFGSAAKPAAAPPAAGATPAAGSAPAAASTGAAPSGAGSGGSTAGASANASPFWTNNDAKTESSYNFNVVTTMEIASSKNTSDKAILKMHYNTKEAYSGTLIISADPKKQQGTAFVILDAKNQAMVMLMASDKSKFSMAYGWTDAQKYAQLPAAGTAAASTQQVNWDTVKVWKNYSKIGTKTIAGYSADGYRMETADGNAELWVSHDARLSVGNMFAANSSMKQMRGRVPDDYPQGMLLQMNGVNSKTGETVTMTVTSIETNANVTYNMSDYPKMGAANK
jgi:uncharacterized protein DUF4412